MRVLLPVKGPDSDAVQPVRDPVARSAGALLSAFLIALLAGKKHRATPERLLIALFAALALWQSAHAGRLFLQVAGSGRGTTAAVLRAITEGGHWMVAGVAALAAAGALWQGLRQAGAGPGGSPCGSARHGGHRVVRPRRLGGDLPVAALTPALALLWFVYRYNLFDLLISRRLVCVTLSLTSAMYLIDDRAGFWPRRWDPAFETYGPLIGVGSSSSAPPSRGCRCINGSRGSLRGRQNLRLRQARNRRGGAHSRLAASRPVPGGAIGPIVRAAARGAGAAWCGEPPQPATERTARPSPTTISRS